MNLTVIIPLVISPTVINTTVIRPKVNSPTNICRTVNVSSVISPIIYYIFVENTNVIITHIRSFDNFISLEKKMVKSLRSFSQLIYLILI
jgi:hypothetical protein